MSRIPRYTLAYTNLIYLAARSKPSFFEAPGINSAKITLFEHGKIGFDAAEGMKIIRE